jgi:hypothetical protein
MVYRRAVVPAGGLYKYTYSVGSEVLVCGFIEPAVNAMDPRGDTAGRGAGPPISITRGRGVGFLLCSGRAGLWSCR